MSLRSYFRPAVDRAFSVVCTSEVTTHKNELSCLASLAIARMFTAAPERAFVTRANSPGLSATYTLNSFILPAPSELKHAYTMELQKPRFAGAVHPERLRRVRS